MAAQTSPRPMKVTVTKESEAPVPSSRGAAWTTSAPADGPATAAQRRRFLTQWRKDHGQ
jgi:hypothetical protein